MASHITHTALATLAAALSLFGATAALADNAPQDGATSADTITLASAKTSTAMSSASQAYAPVVYSQPATYSSASLGTPSPQMELTDAEAVEASPLTGYSDGANLSFSGQGRRSGAEASQP